MKTRIAGRWLVLAAVLLNVIFNYTYMLLADSGRTVSDVSDRYYSHFTPAGYVFSIWGLIYLLFIAYAIYHVIPGRTTRYPDEVNIPLMIANIVSIGWIASFTSGYITVSAGLIFLMLGLAFIIYHTLNINGYTPWIRFPFSLFFGWLTVATLANFATWMVYSGYSAANEPDVSGILIAIAVAAGIFVSYRYRDLVYPAVVCWAVSGIYIKNKFMMDKVATTSFIAAVILAAWITGFGIYLLNTKKKTRQAFRNLDMLND